MVYMYIYSVNILLFFYIFFYLDRPKEIFQCSWPRCDRTFVREDLRARHYKRHEDRGDQYLVSLETPLHENDPQESLPPKKERGRPKGSGKVKTNLLYEMHKALD